MKWNCQNSGNNLLIIIFYKKMLTEIKIIKDKCNIFANQVQTSGFSFNK